MTSARDRFADTYLALLTTVGARAVELGEKAIAAHWPFEGTRQTGLVIAGQALEGWDDPQTTARFHAADVANHPGRQAALAGIESWLTRSSAP